jgi:hypothetical protein
MANGVRSMNAALTALRWGIGENTEADDGSLSFVDDASKVEDELDTTTVSKELPEVVLAGGEMSDSRAVGSSSFVNRPIVGR